MAVPEVSIVGRGRLGRSLYQMLKQRGVDAELVSGADIPTGRTAILCVPDRFIGNVASRARGSEVVLHCSGATSLDPLGDRTGIGSWHPLMTFPGPEILLPDLRGCSAAIDGDPLGVSAAVRLCTQLSMHPLHIIGDRALYHAAAVLAGNFVGVVFADAAELLKKYGVSDAEARRALLPLAQAILQNVGQNGVSALTGPIVRGDLPTVERHRHAIERQAPEFLHEYDVLVHATRRALRLDP